MENHLKYSEEGAESVERILHGKKSQLFTEELFLKHHQPRRSQTLCLQGGMLNVSLPM